MDELADKADANAAKADELNKNSDEVALVKSLIATVRISVDPPSRGAQYGPESGMQIQKAEQINPEKSPRIPAGRPVPVLTPEQFGGDKVKAKETLKLALEKFAAFKPADSIAPHWGEARAKQLLEEAGSKSVG